MAATPFDTLKFARRLKETGVPAAQAEAQAEVMSEALLFNMDTLVTKDYLNQCLDVRFAEQEVRLESRLTAKLESRLIAKMDERFTSIDKRFTAHDARFDKIEAHLHNHDLQFVEVRGELKLHRWMLALILVTAVLPYLQKLFVLLAG